MIGFIVGSGSEELATHPETIKTPAGEAKVCLPSGRDGNFAIISRHGGNHAMLPHQINYRANALALKEVGCTAIISCTVVGVLNPKLKLDQPYLISDLYYPDNRLPNGEACTLFTKAGEKGRGHLIAGSLFNSQLSDIIDNCNSKKISKATYAYSIGPRFNTRLEIKAFQNAGADLISQTCGPEAVLSNELEIPYAMVGYAIDYANGVRSTPTSIEELNKNLNNSAAFFQNLIEKLSTQLSDRSHRSISDKKSTHPGFENFVYRFE